MGVRRRRGLAVEISVRLTLIFSRRSGATEEYFLLGSGLGGSFLSSTFRIAAASMFLSFSSCCEADDTRC
jgi:hypothetical protein